MLGKVECGMETEENVREKTEFSGLSRILSCLWRLEREGEKKMIFENVHSRISMTGKSWKF